MRKKATIGGGWAEEGRARGCCARARDRRVGTDLAGRAGGLGPVWSARSRVGGGWRAWRSRVRPRPAGASPNPPCPALAQPTHRHRGPSARPHPAQPLSLVLSPRPGPDPHSIAPSLARLAAHLTNARSNPPNDPSSCPPRRRSSSRSPRHPSGPSSSVRPPLHSFLSSLVDPAADASTRTTRHGRRLAPCDAGLPPLGRRPRAVCQGRARL